MNTPWKDVFRAVAQIIGVLLALLGGVILTYFPMAFLVAATARKTTNQFGETEQRHDDDYIALGSSGWWEYWASPYSWAKWWNNVEDGTLREPSGKGSARCKGKERTWWNQVLWLFRNPFNGKRNIAFFICMVNECTVTFWGDEFISDKLPPRPGKFLVKAVHKETGKVYYNYRLVKQWPCMFPGWLVTALSWIKVDASGCRSWMKDRIFQIKAGYKVQPSHRMTVQDPDDADKAFTVNIQFYAKAD